MRRREEVERGKVRQMRKIRKLEAEGVNSILDQWRTCLPLGSPFSAKQGLKFWENSRTYISKAYDFPEQVKFIIKALILVKNSDFMHTFDLIFPEQVCLLPNTFPEQGQKVFLGRHISFYLSTVTPSRAGRSMRSENEVGKGKLR